MAEAEFPSNSQSEKKAKPADDKVVEAVIVGEAVRRKAPLSRRFFETFFGGDMKSVSSYVWYEIIVPEAKDLFVNTIIGGTERSVYGIDRASQYRRGSHRPGYAAPSSTGFVQYNRYSSAAPSNRPEPRQSVGAGRRSRSSKNIDEIVLETRVECDAVIDGLLDLISQYEMATVADLYSMVNWPSNPTDSKWGWTELPGAKAQRVTGGGYAIVLPKPEAI